MTMTFHQNVVTAAEVTTHGRHAGPSAVQGLYARFGKRCLDLVIVIPALPLVLPFLIVAAFANILTGNRVFYSQLRLGRKGKVFRIWKLSTMQSGADKRLEDLLRHDSARRQEWETTQKLKNDPRVTRVGAILRCTSIDEIPQLFNVLKGDMSLLGPRPMMLEQVQLYGPNLPIYLSLRPGISGKWQVSERNDAHFRRRAQLDAEYGSDLSLRTDLVLVWQTLRTLARSTGY